MGIILFLLGLLLVVASFYIRYFWQVEETAVPDKQEKEAAAAEEPAAGTGEELEEVLEKLDSRFREMMEQIADREENIRQEVEDLLRKKEELGKPEFREMLEINLQEQDFSFSEKEEEEVDTRVEEDQLVTREKHSQIFAYYEEGMEPEQIAEELGLGIRETRLILKFYREGGD